MCDELDESPYECDCGEPVSPRRYRYLLADGCKPMCLNCGEQQAQRRISQRSKQVMPMHKGNIMLITGRTLAEQKSNILGMASKNVKDSQYN